MYQIIGFSAGLCTLFGLAVYGRSIFSGPTRPVRATWFIWALNAILLLTSYKASGSEETTWIAGAYAIGLFGIAFLTIKHGEKGWTFVDRMSMVGAALGVFLWWLTGSPLIALFASLLIDLSGVIPTIVHAWRYPQKESRFAWGLMLVGSVLGLFAMENWTLVIALYPLQLSITTALIVAFLFRKKNRTANDPLQEIRRNLESGIIKVFPSVEECASKLALDTPPPHIQADYSFSTFFLSAITKEQPQIIAEKIASHFSRIAVPCVEQISSIGPYVNITLNRGIFCQRALKCIAAQGKDFGRLISDQQRLDNVLGTAIQYFWFDSKLKIDVNDLRAVLVGKALKRCLSYNINTISESCYSTNPDIETSLHQIEQSFSSYAAESEFTRESEGVIQDALDQKLAQSVPGSKALWVEHKEAPPFVLRKHDGSPTSMARHLGYVKSFFTGSKFSEALCFSDNSGKLEEVLAAARLLRYISPELIVREIIINRTGNTVPTSYEKNIQYALLRIPLQNKVEIEGLTSNQCVYIDSIMQKLSSKKKRKGVMSDFSIVKKLISFPDIIQKTTENNAPSVLCIYIEQIAKSCDDLGVYKYNDDLSVATLVVLRNGLSLIVSPRFPP